MITTLEQRRSRSADSRGLQNACLLVAYLGVVVTSVWSDPGYSQAWWQRPVTSLWIDLGHSQGVTTLVSLVAFGLVCSVVWAELSRQRLDAQGAISTPRSSSVVAVLRPSDDKRGAGTSRHAAERDRVAHRRAS